MRERRALHVVRGCVAVSHLAEGNASACFFFHNVFPLFYLLREEAQVRCSVRRVSSAMFFRTQHNFLTVCLTFCCGRDLCSYFCVCCR